MADPRISKSSKTYQILREIATTPATEVEKIINLSLQIKEVEKEEGYDKLHMGKVVFANFPYVSTYGEFHYSPLSIEEAKQLISDAYGIESAVGHQATAEIISELLDVNCPVNRIQYEQPIQDVMIVFKLNKRMPEGEILDRQTLEEVGFTLGKLVRCA